MIKLQDLIKEYKATDEKIDTIFLTDNDYVINLLQTSYKTAWKQYFDNNAIYRGIKSKHNPNNNVLLVKPSTFERRSKNTTNFYTALLSILPSWVDYPKRSRSVICSTNSLTASGYGNNYLILPENGARIGICPTEDIWDSFDNIKKRWDVKSLTIFNDRIEMLAYTLDEDLYFDLRNVDESNILDYVQKLNKYANADWIDKNLKTDNTGDEDFVKNNYPEIAEDILKNFKGDWLTYFDDLLNPMENGFMLSNIEYFQAEDDREVWTDDNVIAIPGNRVKEFVKNV